MIFDEADAAAAEAPEAPEPSEPADLVEKTLVRGRSAATPFALLGGVALVIWVVVALVALVLLLVWWLV